MAASTPAAAAAAPSLVAKAVAGFTAPVLDSGKQIFVYNHIRTNQIVYSLTRSMKNTKAIKQIPFVGKNTVPRALRKDHWTPLCVLSFTNQLQGLNAYHKLREFKHLHEVAYPIETVTQKEGKHAGQLMSKKDKGRVLMNQKANSIADMAAVLEMQARPPTKEELDNAKMRVYGPAKLRNRPKPRKGHGSHETAEALEFRGNMDGVSVWWANPLDAEYAETWPKDVLHGPLAVNRGTAIWPPPEEIVSEMSEIERAEREAEAKAQAEKEGRVEGQPEGKPPQQATSETDSSKVKAGQYTVRPTIRTSDGGSSSGIGR